MIRSLPAPISGSATLVFGMPALPVASSLLTCVAYDHDRAILQLEFRSGAVYQYFRVPRQSYQELLQADSHGAYFNRHIRRSFQYARLQPAGNLPSSILCSKVTCPTQD
jgi:KTSC domain